MPTGQRDRFPNAGGYGGPLAAPVISNSKISTPPIFNAERFLVCKKEYQFWGDLYWYIPDRAIAFGNWISCLAIDEVLHGPVRQKYQSRSIPPHHRLLSGNASTSIRRKCT